MSTPEQLMREALLQAERALEGGEVPIGCVVLDDITGEIIARAHNSREIAHDPTAHAEIIALRQAASARGHWRLTDCTLVVTLEPCPMCAGALVNARVPRLIYGCDDPKAGAVRTLFQICTDARLNHRVQITAGVLADECAAILSGFFQTQRAAGKK
ncbi:MAG: tRNA adenosine(34) deaminase TadA [Tepidisphaeraceae bacterium]